MSDTVNTAEIRVTADASGVEAGLQPAITAAQRAERAISGIGTNSARSQSNLIAAIQRTTASMEAGSRTGARYYEIIARQRGVDPAILEPYLRQLRAVEEAQRQAAESAGETSGRIEKSFAALRGGAIVAAVAAMVLPVVSAQREFDKLNASLITATGSSEKAAQAFGALQTFAATTPFGLAETTEAFVKMRNLGLDPSERALRSYGNTAAAMSKSLEQMVEAVADASTGEFERLKEFGIKASQNGEKLTLTFKGTSTTIKNEAEAIEKYLTRIGEVDFAGAMVRRAATLDGAISQLGDSWESFLRTASSSGMDGVARDGVDVLSTALGNLETILQSVSAAADKQKDSLLSIGTVNKAITIGLEAVSVLGLNVAYVFTQVRNEFVGLGRQAHAVATGDFAKARAIGEQMKSAADRDRKEVDRQTAAILGAVEKAKKAAEATPKASGADALAEFRIQREKERESEEAAKKREAAARKVAELLKKEAGILAELSGLTRSFSEDWMQLTALYGKGKLSIEGLTKAQADLLAKQPAMRDAAEQEIKDRKASIEAAEQYADAYEAAAKGAEIAKSNLQAQRDENAQIGLSAEALAELNAERLEALALQAENKIWTAEGLDISGQMAQKYRDEAAALRELADAKREGARKQISVDSAKQAGDDWKRAAESIEQSLTDALLRGFESGKSFGKNLIDTLKNMFSTLVLKPVIQGVMAPVTGALVGGMPGAAQASGGGAGGALSAASSLGGIAGLFGAGGLTGSVMAGAGWLTGATTLGGSLAAAGSLAATGSLAGIASSIGMAAGALGPIALGIGAAASLLKGAFGMKDKEYGATTLVGTFNPAGFNGTRNTAWTQEGGWLRSDKSGVDWKQVDSETAKILTASYDALKAASADFASVLGINADSIKDRAQALSIVLTGDQAKDQQAIADFFIGVGNTIAGELLPSLTAFQKDGEAASSTLQRLATGYALIDTALTSIGMAFGTVGVSSLEARERLLEASGGLEAFGANTAGFQQNFLTEAERNAPVLKSLTEQLAAMGLSSVDTRDEFKQVVLGLDLTSEAGAKQYGSLMKLQAAFAQVYPAIDSAAIAAAELAKAEERANAIREQRVALQDQLDTLTMSSAQLLLKQRDALDESNRALFDQVQAAQAAKSAAEALSSVNQGFEEQITTILRARMGEVELRAAETAGMDASTAALYDRLAALKAEDVAAQAAAKATEEASARHRAFLDETMNAAWNLAQNAPKQQVEQGRDPQSIAGERANIEKEILQLQGDTVALRALELAGLDPANQALKQRVFALQDEAQAAAVLKAIASERKSLQDQLDELTMTSAQLLEKQRNALDGSNRALFDQIQAAKEQKTATEQATEAIKKAQEAAAESVRSMGNAFVAAMDRASAAAAAIRDFSDSLKLGNLSALDPDAKYREARKQFEAAKPEDTQAAQAFLQASKDRGADDFYYQRDFAAVQEKLVKGAAGLDAYVKAIPSLFRGFIGDVSAPAPVPTPVATSPVLQSGTMSKSSAAQAESDALRTEVKEMREQLGTALQSIADSTADTARYIGKVTNKGNAMVTV